MDRTVYHDMQATEETHWWFLARRHLCRSLLMRYAPDNAAILEAGCGSGGNLPLLQLFGNVYAFELDEQARARAAERGIGHVAAGSLPADIPFADTLFDLILMTDVLEHIEGDQAALTALNDRLKPGGRLLLTVPAFPFLFSRHDVLHHHFRRYRKKELHQLLKQAGFAIEVLSFWNMLLFVPAAFMRWLEKKQKSDKPSAGSAIPPAPLNRLLAVMVGLERFFLKWPGLPFGISLIAVAKKPE